MQERVRKHIANSHRLRQLRHFLISVRIRNRQVSLFRIIVVFLDKLRAADVFERAYGVAFNLTLSVFPAIIFFFAMLAFLPVVDDIQTMVFLREVLPASIYELIDNTIRDILSRPRGGLLSFGVIFALFLATSGMVSLMSAFNRIHLTIERRSFLKTRGIATFLTLILAIVMVMAIALLVVGQFVINWMYHQNTFLKESLFYLIISLRFLIMFIFFLLAISSIYYLGPSIEQRWSFFSPGSILASFFCLAASFLFSAYISNFQLYNKVYGSIGALIALMVWIYMISAILLLGYTVNASIDVALDRTTVRTRQPPPVKVERVAQGHPAE
ncbi:MAG: YihY/virulence factor BrkB family protein [Bacteroidetes bacterium]|nr:YihY/virulence factor BrkB family protein [Bacteroidota bacterium]